MWYHTHSMCPTLVTRQTSMQSSSSDQTLCSISGVTELTAAVMCSCSLSTVAGSEGTQTLSFTYPQREKNHKWSGPVILGATCRTPGHLVQRGQSICLASAILLKKVVMSPAAGGENSKFLELMYLQSHIYKNIPINF